MVVAAFGCRSFHLLFGMAIMIWNKNRLRISAFASKCMINEYCFGFDINRNLSISDRLEVRKMLFEGMEN